jgi:tripartite-type tricarboxylate transporter receptor subunit TctC
VFRSVSLAIIGLTAAVGAAACGQTSSESPASAVEQFYATKTVTIVVGSDAGGGFDTTARLVSHHIGRHIPGNPTVIVQNMTGGGMVAASYVYNVAPKDSTVIGLFHEAQVMSQLTGGEGVDFDLRKVSPTGPARRRSRRA